MRARFTISDMGQPQFVLTSHRLQPAGRLAKLPSIGEASRQKMRRWRSPIRELFAAANFSMRRASATSKHHGCEVYVAAGSRHERGKDKRKHGQERGEGEPGAARQQSPVLLCESLEGYHNLIKLVSAGFLEGFYYKRASTTTADRSTAGIIASRRCRDDEAERREFDLARENAYRLRDFRQREFLLEIQTRLGNRKAREPQLVLSKNREFRCGHKRLPLPASRRCARAGVICASRPARP